jgi:hypothetical protein
VKIGVSANPSGRIKGMQTTRPDIKLLADIPGGRKTEAHLHERFHEFHIAGEWFRFGMEIQDFLEKELPVFVKEELAVVESESDAQPKLRKRPKKIKGVNIFEVMIKRVRYWRVVSPKPDKGRIDRNFRNQHEARNFYEREVQFVRNFGRAGGGLSVRHQLDAIVALKALVTFEGATLTSVAEFYAKHHSVNVKTTVNTN